MKNINDLEPLFLSSPKTGNSLIIPLGYDKDNIKELSFSCRGKIRNRYGSISTGNINGYSIHCNIGDEGINLLSGLLINLCKKYTREEALFSYYNFSDIPQNAFNFIDKLPNANRICHSAIDEQFEAEMEKLHEQYDTRYRYISQYSDCYARATAVAQQNEVKFNLSQEILLFHISKKDYELKHAHQFEKHIHFLTQQLWRVGIYPIAFFERDSVSFDFQSSRNYFGCEIILPSSRRIRKESSDLKHDEVLLSTGWDSWDWSAEGQEIFKIPRYDEEWILDNLHILK